MSRALVAWRQGHRLCVGQPRAPRHKRSSGVAVLRTAVQDSWSKFALSEALLKHAHVNKLPSRDRLATALVHFFDARQSSLELINSVLEHEAREALLRSDNFLRSHESTPVRLIHVFWEVEGADFLRRILSPLHSAMSAAASEAYTEQVIAQKSLALTTQMLQAIHAALENGSFPLSLWRVLISVFQIGVRANLPRPIEGVSCVLFLRYLHAALISPEAYHMSTHALPVATQKIAVHIAKLSQAAVNAVVERKPEVTFTTSADYFFLSIRESAASPCGASATC
jgi:hypothetical protein